MLRILSLFLFIVISAVYAMDSWKDPDKKINIPNQKNLHHSNSLIKNNDSSIVEVMEEMKQIVANWMFLSGFQNFNLPNGEKKSVSLILTLSSTDLNSINLFLNNPSYSNFIGTTPILNRFFTLKSKPLFNIVTETTNSETYKKWLLISYDCVLNLNKETVIILISVVMFYVLARALWNGIGIKYVIGFFIATIFFAGFVWNWLLLYQEAMVDQHLRIRRYEDFASKCELDTSFYGFFKKFFFGNDKIPDECREYYRGKDIDAFIMVPPSKALSMTLTMLITGPMEQIGESLKKVSLTLFGDVWFGQHWGAPLVLIVFLLFFFFVLATLLGNPIRLKNYFFTVELNNSIDQRDMITNMAKYLEEKNILRVNNSKSSLENTRNIPRIEQLSPSNNSNSDQCVSCNRNSEMNTFQCSNNRSNYSDQCVSCNRNSEINTFQCSNNRTCTNHGDRENTCNTKHNRASCVSQRTQNSKVVHNRHLGQETLEQHCADTGVTQFSYNQRSSPLMERNVNINRRKTPNNRNMLFDNRIDRDSAMNNCNSIELEERENMIIIECIRRRKLSI